MLPVFRSYDIRGTYPDEFNEEIAAAAAAAFARVTKSPSFVLGYDMRLSSPFIQTAVTNTLLREGAYVVDIGMVPTPLVGFTMRELGIPAGIMISASHNPPEYNALKLQVLTKNGMINQLGLGSGLEQVGELAEQLLSSDIMSDKLRLGKRHRHDPRPAYLAYMKEQAKELMDVSIVADYGNGVGAITAKPFFEAARLPVTHLFAEPDGIYPNHPADPHHLENFATLRQMVPHKNANVGLFFDGDADRVIAVDELGRIVEADIMLAVLAAHKLKEPRHRGASVYHDLRASRAVIEGIAISGGVPQAMPVGNPPMKKRLASEGGVMAGENSGHIMFAEHAALDDGLFTAVQLLRVMNGTNKLLSALAEPYRRFARTPEFSVPRQGDTEAVYARLAAEFPKARQVRLDGLTLEEPDWWMNVRPSNTEPILRVNIEAKNQKLLKVKERKVRKALKKR